MKERILVRLSLWLRRKTEEALDLGDHKKALHWSRLLDSVVYQLICMKNRGIIQQIRTEP